MRIHNPYRRDISPTTTELKMKFTKEDDTAVFSAMGRSFPLVLLATRYVAATPPEAIIRVEGSSKPLGGVESAHINLIK